MNNDQEPQSDGASEDRSDDSQLPRDGSRDTNAGAPSDAGWRDVLSGLGVDIHDDRAWQAEREERHSKPRRMMSEDKASTSSQPESGEDERSRNAGRDTKPRQSQGRHEMEERAQWISESEVSIEKLYELFDGAYMECELDEDGDLRIVTDSGPRIFLSLHEPNKLVRYMAFYKFREEIVEYEKLLFVNALNDDIVFIRFSLNGVDTLIADYYLPYSRGTSPFQIINAAKLMGRVITSGIRQHDTNNLLE